MKENSFSPHLSLVIPVYNEKERIKKSLRNIVPYLEQRTADYEIILVDDGSSDNTLEVIEGIRNEHFRILKNERNCGKGYAVQKGMLKSRFPLVLFSDADLSCPIEELEKFLPYLKDNDIVICSRGMKESKISLHQPFYKEWLGKLGNKFIRLLLLPAIHDTQCGFKLFKKEALVVFQKQTVKRWGFDFEILLVAQKMGFRIKEVPVRWQNDKQSKVKHLDYLKTFGELLKIRWNILTNKYNIKNHGRKTNL